MVALAPFPCFRRFLVPALVLGVMLAAVAAGQDTRSGFLPVESVPALPAAELPLDALFLAPSVPALDRQVALARHPGPPAPLFKRGEDGTTVVTIQWDSREGETIERRSAEVVIGPSPEPTPIFLGACAGCVFLLLRRRTSLSSLQPARASLFDGQSARRRRTRQAEARGSLPVSRRFAPDHRHAGCLAWARPAGRPRFAPLRAR